MGTREGGVHVLKMSFNREEDSCSDVHSSLSAAHSRPSTPAVGDHGLELAGESPVRAHVYVLLVRTFGRGARAVASARIKVTCFLFSTLLLYS